MRPLMLQIGFGSGNGPERAGLAAASAFSSIPIDLDRDSLRYLEVRVSATEDLTLDEVYEVVSTVSQELRNPEPFLVTTCAVGATLPGLLEVRLFAPVGPTAFAG